MKTDDDGVIVKKKIRVEVHCKTKEVCSVVSRLNMNILIKISKKNKIIFLAKLKLPDNYLTRSVGAS